jgi:hypothetical protein
MHTTTGETTVAGAVPIIASLLAPNIASAQPSDIKRANPRRRYFSVPGREARQVPVEFAGISGNPEGDHRCA